jgi:hypothetical protein
MSLSSCWADLVVEGECPSGLVLRKDAGCTENEVISFEM